MIYLSDSRNTNGSLKPYNDTTVAGVTKGMYGNDVYTKTLLHFDNEHIIDSYTVACWHFDADLTDAVGSHDLTPHGGAAIGTTVYKWSPGSLALDGAGDYAELTSDADFRWGTSPFTICLQVRFNSLTGEQFILSSDDNGVTTYFFDLTWRESVGQLRVRDNGTGKAYNWSPVINTWYHLEFDWDGANDYLFVNGVRITGAGSWTGDGFNCNTQFIVAGRYDGTNNLNGYLDEIKIDKGVCRHVANFTPPTGPYYDASQLADSSLSSHTVSTGGASVTSAQKKFGPASVYFDGASYCSVVNSADYDFGAGNFTVDAWVYFSSLSTSYIATKYQDVDNRWLWYYDATNGLKFDIEDASVETLSVSQGGVTGWSISQWYHIALFRSGSNWYITRDGLVIASATSAITIPSYTGTLYIGQRGTGANYLSGYLDELRVSKGIARWTGAFTVPTRQYA